MNKSTIPSFKLGLPGRAHGLSLIELMIALTLGMLVIATIGYAYVSSRTTFRQQDALGRMQENARYVFELLSNDIRMTGYAGSFCGLAATEVVNALPSPANWDQDIFGSPLKGYENAGTIAPDVSADVYKGDALAVLRADSTREYIVNAAAATGAALTFSGDEPADGNVIVTGCSNAKPRQAFALAEGANGLATTIASQSRIMPLIASLYYIRLNAADPAQPALYRRNGAGVSEELVEGVEDMQISYGVDTSIDCATNDRGVDTYVEADAVEATVPCATPAEDWNRVLSARVRLVMRSVEDGITTESQTYTFDDGTTATDRRLRKEFATTIAVRNRL
jgi:type IV pilus assembly protein PilW